MADNEIQAIKAYQGKLFKVALRSNFGSTNIGWCLTSLPKGIALLAEEHEAESQRTGRAVQQVFYFCAVDSVENEDLEFRLIKHSPVIRKEEQLKTVTLKVQVVSYDPNSDIGKDNFVEYHENAANVSGGSDDDCTRVLKYGYPPYMKYGYPVDYAPRVKYGYPGNPPNVKYGYPPVNPACSVETDDCGCPVVKYGYPSGAGNASPLAPLYNYPCDMGASCEPVVEADGVVRHKYGYLAGTGRFKYGYPNTAGVKYGYPPESAACQVYYDDCGCPTVVKYGYPVR